MRTVTFKSVFDSVLILRGHDPAVISNIDQVPYREIAAHIGRRVREGWEHAFFPEWTLIEERTVEAGGVISLVQTGKTRIGTVKELWNANPRTTDAAATLDYLITSDGIQTELDAAETAWVEFRKRAPRFTTTYYQSTNQYQPGNVVFWPVTEDTQLYGNCYEARETATPGTYEWQLQEIPFVLEQWVIWASFADCLMQDGQRERALQMLSEVAKPELARAVLVEIGQQGLSEGVRIRI